MNPALLGFLRGLGFTIILAGLTYLGDSANLSGVVSTGLATVIASLALALEHAIASSTGNALFGAVSTR